MDSLDLLAQLRKFTEERANEDNIKNAKENERATINGLVSPFLRILGWDSENLDEVFPEYPVQTDFKHNRKCDIALLLDKSPVVLIEVKSAAEDLNPQADLKQLDDYVKSSEVELGLLTNGVQWQWYSSITGKKSNVLNKKAVLTYDIRRPAPSSLNWMQFMHRRSLDPSKIQVNAAIQRESISLKSWIRDIFENPSPAICELAIDNLKLEVEESDKDCLIKAVGDEIRKIAPNLQFQYPNEDPVGDTSDCDPTKDKTLSDESQLVVDFTKGNMKWRVGGGDWTHVKNGIAMHKEVLLWLADICDSRTGWCQKMCDAQSTYFRLSSSWSEKRRVHELFSINDQESFWVDCNISIDNMKKILRHAAENTICQGKSVNLELVG